LRDRILLAIGIVFFDMFIFIVPLVAIVLAYVLIARPVWFRDWVLQLYGD